MPEAREPLLPLESCRVYTVSELNAEVHQLLETTYPFVWLEGEISNFRHFQASGHWYFSLKDPRSQVSAAMFRSSNRQVRFQPEDGMSVLLCGRVSLYESRGTYQIIASRIEPRGAGALSVAFEQLKAALQAEGLFAADAKRDLPLLPRRIGVVTSPDGAALRDILRLLGRRHSGVSVLVLPTRVQGAGAAPEIATAIRRAAEFSDLDVLIVGRGGGSLEDLWAFNEEEVARALAASPIPTISAVGHEVDITIADLVADCRASTPSAAAELVVASRQELMERVHGLDRRLAAGTRLLLAKLAAGPAGRFAALASPRLQSRLRHAGQACDEWSGRLERGASQRLSRLQERLGHLGRRLSPANLRSTLAARGERLQQVTIRLATAGRGRIRRSREELAAAGGRLQGLSPLAVLERGYSLAQRVATGELIRNATEVTVGERVRLRLHRGCLELETVKIQPAKEAG